MLHKDEIIIEKIIKEINFATKRLKGMSQEDFITDEDAQHAVGMAAINIGELVKHISDELRKEAPHVPWKEAAGLRDVAAHSYDTIRMDDLFDTVTTDFPALMEKLKNLH